MKRSARDLSATKGTIKSCYDFAFEVTVVGWPMSRITPVSWKRLRCVFEHDGFVFKPGRGDHWKGEKAGVARPIIIPAYDELGVDIIRSCMRTAGMTRERYLQLLEKC